jgi:hypothetical protein
LPRNAEHLLDESGNSYYLGGNSILFLGYAANSDRSFDDSFLEVSHDTTNSLFELFLVIMMTEVKLFLESPF